MPRAFRWNRVCPHSPYFEKADAYQKRSIRVDAECEKHLRRVDTTSLQFVRVVVNGHCMQVNNAVDRVVVVLELHPVPKRTEVVAKMDIACRLNAREDLLLHPASLPASPISPVLWAESRSQCGLEPWVLVSS